MDKLSANPLPDLATQRVGLCLAVLPEWVTQLQLAQSSASQAVTQMVLAFASIEAQALECKDAACPIDAIQRDRMYQGFQYQDRLNQMLELVVRDIQRLYAVMGSEGTGPLVPNAAGWLERLQAEFVMAEQLGLAPASHLAHDREAGNDVTFF